MSNQHPSAGQPPGMLRSFVLSFFSRSFYRDVGQRGRGLGFGYLAVVLALLWLPVMVQVHLAIVGEMATEVLPILAQVPPLSVKAGVVTCECAQPFILQDEAGEPQAIIDTTGATTSLEGSSAKILVMRTKILYAKSPGETRTYDLSGVDEFHLNREVIQKWVRWLGRGLAALLFPFAWGGSFAYRILQALLYGALGVLIARFLGARLEYTALVRLAVYAVTPVLVLCTVTTVADINIPLWWTICFFLAMGYLTFAIKANVPAPEGTL